MGTAHKNKNSFLKSGLICLALSLAACSGQNETKAEYPHNPSGRDPYENKQSVAGPNGLGSLIGGARRNDGATLGVNAYLWRASLDTISFMPIASADPFGGTIITEYYSSPQAPDERFKMNILILDTQLRADGVHVSLFRQTKDKRGAWRDDTVDKAAATDIENAILTRARALKVAQDAKQ